MSNAVSVPVGAPCGSGVPGLRIPAHPQLMSREGWPGGVAGRWHALDWGARVADTVISATERQPGRPPGRPLVGAPRGSGVPGLRIPAHPQVNASRGLSKKGAGRLRALGGRGLESSGRRTPAGRGIATSPILPDLGGVPLTCGAEAHAVERKAPDARLPDLCPCRPAPPSSTRPQEGGPSFSQAGTEGTVPRPSR